MKNYLLLFIMLLSSGLVYSQSDSLSLVNNDIIVGEIKSMDKGVVTIETAYSDNDFKIEWDGVKRISTVSSFIITLSDGSRYNGKMESVGNAKIKLITDDGETKIIGKDDLVFLKSVDKGFWNRIYANIDIGFELSKANNLKSFSTQSRLGYLARKWALDFSFNDMFSRQDSIADIKRTEGGMTFKYYLPRNWYIPVTINYLANTEQRLDYRWNGLLGADRFIVHTNSLYWSIGLGASFNNEKYSPLDEAVTTNSSWEGYFGTELNMFDFGDLSLLTDVNVFPSITEKGRWRIDFNFEAKYDLPLDFYIKLSYALNFDNRPVNGASDLDYGLTAGFGWEW